jgi:hypothetical protein
VATTLPRGVSLGTLEPADAVRAFQARGQLEPTFRWTDVWQQEQAAKFMVAGVAQADMLRLFRTRLDDALRTGLSPADFSRALKPELVRAGWWGDIEITDPATGEVRVTRFNDARLRLIYDTNLRQSYAAGRYTRAVRNQRRLPLLMYRTMRDERVRASHAAWDSLVLPVGHPFWQQHYPPNAWRCRCTAFALSEKDLARRQAGGERFKTDPPPDVQVPYTDPRTGEERLAPRGVDPAFAYNPGQVFMDNAAGLQRNSLTASAPRLAEAQVRQHAAGPNMVRFLREPALGETVPVAMRQGTPIVLTPAAVGRARDDAARGATALGAELPGAEWQGAVQAALDAGVRVVGAQGRPTYVQQLPGGSVVVLELQLTQDGMGQRVVQVHRLRVLLPEQLSANPEVQQLLAKVRRAQQGGGRRG